MISGIPWGRASVFSCFVHCSQNGFFMVLTELRATGGKRDEASRTAKGQGAGRSSQTGWGSTLRRRESCEVEGPCWWRFPQGHSMTHRNTTFLGCGVRGQSRGSPEWLETEGDPGKEGSPRAGRAPPHKSSADRRILRHRGDPKQWVKGNHRRVQLVTTPGTQTLAQESCAPRSSLKFLS